MTDAKRSPSENALPSTRDPLTEEVQTLRMEVAALRHRNAALVEVCRLFAELHAKDCTQEGCEIEAKIRSALALAGEAK